VVANGDPVTLKLFDARGRHIRNIGRAGEGPGDFPYAVEFGEWPGDSILAMSGGGIRRTLFRRDGTIVREWTASASEPRFSANVHRRAVVRYPSSGLHECLRQVVAAIPMPAVGRFHEVLPAPGGRVWVRLFGERTWQVHNPDGRLIARVTLPDRFDPFRITDSLVIGRAMDDDDMERVEAWVVRSPPTRPAACEEQRATFAQGEFPAERGATLRSTMRRLAVVGEVFYRDQGHYPAKIADVAQHITEEGFDLTVLANSGAGWAFALADRASGATCLMSIGKGVLVAWPDGVIVCGG
jgi:hypothetical protein